MSADLIFSICSSAILPGWLLLVFLPRWKWTLGLISAGLIPFALALVYAGLFASQIGSMPEGGGFGSLTAVSILFTNPYLLAGGWIHYLAFDLFIGSWEVQDSQKQGIPHWMVIPCLALTLMLGPLGLAAYLLLRFIRTHKLRIYEVNKPLQ